MKFSEYWLRELVQPPLDTQALADQLSLAGLEVDDIEAVAKPFSGVVVAEILSAEQHPDADKLRVCQVNDGSETFQVVCGAPNARAGLKSAFARVGAVLPGNFKIKKAKLRGVESFGMICAEDELGISDDHDGIMELPVDAPLGVDIRDYLRLDDAIIDVDLTPNRGDCLGMIGMAREVGVLNKVEVNPIEVTSIEPTLDATLPIELAAPKACPRYLGRIFKGVDLSAPTPKWMVTRLERSGVRSIDPVVDVTNYVLLELGQPMHAFDLDKLEGGIRVRMAEQGESLRLLDDSEITLNSDTLVIADHTKAVAMAGIMGGGNSEVSQDTQNILLECAYFDPIAIAGRARNYGLHTDASHRYERGVDWNLQARAVERATRLLLDIVGGEVGPVVEAVSQDDLPKPVQVRLRHERVTETLAIELPLAEIEEILTRLGMALEQESDGVWQVAVPSYRFDISIEMDLIEEIARVYGYNNLPSKTPLARLPLPSIQEARVSSAVVRRHLVSRGYQEAVTYSFIESTLAQQFDDQHQAVALANPISAEMAVMRTSILPGLCKAVKYNQARQQTRIRLFEIGQTFISEGESLNQDAMLSGVVCGNREADSWSGSSEKVDFFDLKGDVESLLALGGAESEFSFKADQHVALHPGQSARIERAGQSIGWLGALHPSLVKAMDLNGPVLVFELRLDAVTAGQLPKFAGLSKFPESRRDLALVVDQSVNYAEVRRVALEAGGSFLQTVRLFDLYTGQGIEAGRKSLAVGLTYQHPSRTLNEEEINASVESVVQTLGSTLGATLRT